MTVTCGAYTDKQRDQQANETDQPAKLKFLFNKISGSNEQTPGIT